ncbi:SHOCT domain-containing protein [Streptomyces sioyaensis]|uniref:SHOCT domain-containing protein n=1 Tax=Streptomyces sioyaensis TaxID=67364 RepID=UPI003D75D0AC
MMWFDGGWGWGGGWFMMALLMVVFWGLVIVAVITVVHYVRAAPRDGRPAPSGQRAWDQGQGHAEDLLAERFARGEIDEDEYKRRLTLLRENR